MLLLPPILTAESAAALAILLRRMRDKILIGYGQGFWGDSILGPVRLVRAHDRPGGPIHGGAVLHVIPVAVRQPRRQGQEQAARWVKVAQP